MAVSHAGGIGRDVKAMGLVGLAHGCSHFFQLVLPSLFLYLVTEFDTGYTELGALMTMFFVISGCGQPIAGFVVDRFGARTIMFAGLATYCTGLLLASMAPSLWWMVPAMAVAALGNCVFHPVDFTIMNASISPSRLGRAFSIHTLGGNLGWALAPVSMLSLGELFGWRVALASAACLGLAVLAVLLLARADLKQEAPAGKARTAMPALGIGLLFSGPVLLCFAYFLLLAAAQIAVQNFLPVTLAALYETPLQVAGMALTGFLLGASAGVLAGGFVADATPRHGGVVALGLLGASLVFLLVSAVNLESLLLVGVVGAAGFLQGVTTPSRDLLVRASTPPGATGRVFGFVYSGLDAGSAIAPVTVGLILDHGDARWIFWFVALMLFGAIFTAVNIGTAARLQPQPAE